MFRQPAVAPLGIISAVGASEDCDKDWAGKAYTNETRAATPLEPSHLSIGLATIFSTGLPVHIAAEMRLFLKTSGATSSKMCRDARYLMIRPVAHIRRRVLHDGQVRT